MRQYGLIGYPLSHSWSATHFEMKFSKEGISDASYRLFPLQDIRHFPALIRETPLLMGLNVTIPYKEKIIPFLNALSDTARAIGAVNTITVEQGGRDPFLTGHNTDAYGFSRSLELNGITTPGRALVLGTGGASKAVCHVLDAKGWDYLLVSRKSTGGQAITYGDLEARHLETHPLIINTTPLGMFPDTRGRPPIPYGHLSGKNILYDLVYNPEQTRFMALGKSKGCRVVGGLQMLVLQAERSWEIWNT